jgi:[calcium/calmodulin-dependent protein kinase] kinase
MTDNNCTAAMSEEVLELRADEHDSQSQDTTTEHASRDTPPKSAPMATPTTSAPAIPAMTPTSTIPPTCNPTTVETRRDYPIYPNQALSALQSQIHSPPYLPRPIRTLSSHQSNSTPSIFAGANNSRHPKELSNIDTGSRTAGNTPLSSPGLFAPSTASHQPILTLPTEGNTYSSPYLHWSQSQQIKE